MELAFKGSAKDTAGTLRATLDALFTPDGRSVGGSALPLKYSWSALRQLGAAVAVEPGHHHPADCSGAIL